MSASRDYAAPKGGQHTVVTWTHTTPIVEQVATFCLLLLSQMNWTHHIKQHQICNTTHHDFTSEKASAIRPCLLMSNFHPVPPAAVPTADSQYNAPPPTPPPCNTTHPCEKASAIRPCLLMSNFNFAPAASVPNSSWSPAVDSQYNAAPPSHAQHGKHHCEVASASGPVCSCPKFPKCPQGLKHFPRVPPSHSQLQSGIVTACAIVISASRPIPTGSRQPPQPSQTAALGPMPWFCSTRTVHRLKVRARCIMDHDAWSNPTRHHNSQKPSLNDCR